MKPTIYYKGDMYKIRSIWFDDINQEISHISFDYEGVLKTLFSDEYDLKSNVIWEVK